MASNIYPGHPDLPADCALVKAHSALHRSLFALHEDLNPLMSTDERATVLKAKVSFCMVKTNGAAIVSYVCFWIHEQSIEILICGYSKDGNADDENVLVEWLFALARWYTFQAVSIAVCPPAVLQLQKEHGFVPCYELPGVKSYGFLQGNFHAITKTKFLSRSSSAIVVRKKLRFASAVETSHV